jgi:hypothetical protein
MERRYSKLTHHPRRPHFAAVRAVTRASSSAVAPSSAERLTIISWPQRSRWATSSRCRSQCSRCCSRAISSWTLRRRGSFARPRNHVNRRPDTTRREISVNVSTMGKSPANVGARCGLATPGCKIAALIPITSRRNRTANDQATSIATTRRDTSWLRPCTIAGTQHAAHIAARVREGRRDRHENVTFARTSEAMPS